MFIPSRTTLFTACIAAVAAPSLAGTATMEWHSQYVSRDTVRIWADLIMTPDDPDDFVAYRVSSFQIEGDDTVTDGHTLNGDESAGLGRFFHTAGFPAILGFNGSGIIRPSQVDPSDPALYTETTVNDFFVFELTLTDFTPRDITFTANILRKVLVWELDANGQPANANYDTDVIPTTFTVQAVPLPSPAVAGLVMGSGLLGVRASRRRRNPNRL